MNEWLQVITGVEFNRKDATQCATYMLYISFNKPNRLTSEEWNTGRELSTTCCYDSVLEDFCEYTCICNAHV